MFTDVDLFFAFSGSFFLGVIMTFRTLCLLSPDGASHLRSLLLSVPSYVVNIVTEMADATDVVQMCKQLHPDLIFYDPTLDDGAFLFERQKAPNGSPVLACYTADVRFAVDAFEAGAVHYLLPTSDALAIETALHRAARRMSLYTERAASHPFVLREAASQMAKMIALPLQSGIDIRPCDQIVHVHGEGNYARVVFQRDPSVIVSRSIGDCEETLHDRGFLRVHRSHLVNLVHVRRVLRGKQQRLCMSNGDEVEVSERYRDELMEHLNVIGRRRR